MKAYETDEYRKEPPNCWASRNDYDRNKKPNYYSWSQFQASSKLKECFGVRLKHNHRWMVHNLYYGQPAFVTKEIRDLVLTLGSPDFLAKAYKLDKNFNTIPLSNWDSIAIYQFPDDVRKAILESGCKGITLSIKICVLKCAARIIAEPKEWR